MMRRNRSAGGSKSVPRAKPAPSAPALVGAALRETRLAKRLTLKQVADRARLSVAFLSRLERGQTSSSLSNLMRLSTVLGVPLERLFAANSQPFPQGGFLL